MTANSIVSTVLNGKIMFSLSDNKDEVIFERRNEQPGADKVKS